MVVVAGFLAFWMWMENKRRDQKWGSGGGEEAVEDGFSNKTDGEAKYFRYAL
jgi:hypothetical protein